MQGRVLYDLILYRMKADKMTVLIECQHDVTSDLISNLLRYRLRKKVSRIIAVLLSMLFNKDD